MVLAHDGVLTSAVAILALEGFDKKEYPGDRQDELIEGFHIGILYPDALGALEKLFETSQKLGRLL